MGLIFVCICFLILLLWIRVGVDRLEGVPHFTLLFNGLHRDALVGTSEAEGSGGGGWVYSH